MRGEITQFQWERVYYRKVLKLTFYVFIYTAHRYLPHYFKDCFVVHWKLVVAKSLSP